MSIEQEIQIQFRSMVVDDIPQVLDVERDAFPHPWTGQAFRDELTTNPFARYLVLEIEGTVVGYCGMWVIIDEAHITNIAVHSRCRGKGFGELLLRYAMEFSTLYGAEKMTLEVRASNQIAQQLYKKLDFEVTGLRPNYYSDNKEDALIMWVTYK
ncbi:ribosomal-protein-alanine N-acetyltransferase [Thermoactinomyces sp. DSM 45891]|uniref:ribosomal protein S18-alanine N-acetyltransferase n=1 Tax=Thermoactinomyces sp. DSM 45891 TaxID=1761907 RepID=UPI000921C558|nr:ribosomal protein S18-alanine N-acetyltransferase [Thermoactinomyces sp. DSM 45891]SFX71064.1 ribosomal-protein-alanine N-acetyltransferase [Thermoactinomyces sp. DSM 45891]